ncbi:MAG: hypothetical protein WC356_05755 [Candidatus Micrarchaeia archaeon]|jgi:hypothetical protein
MKKIFGILILILMVSSVFADLQISNYEVLPETARPGVKGTVTLTLSNGGTDQLKRVSASVQPSSGIEALSSIYIGDMESGGTSFISVPFTVKETTPSGVYSLRVLIRGTKEVLGSSDESISRAIDIPIYVNRPPSLSIISTDKKFIIGERFNTNLTILKEGGSATDVKIYSSDENFIIDNSPVYVGDINENQITFQISGYISSSMDAGILPTNLSINYFDILGNEYTESLTPSFEFEEQKHELGLNLVPADFKSGETKEVQLTIVNNGQNTLEDIELTLEETSVFVPLSGERVNFDRLEPGEEKTKNIKLGIKDVSPGYYLTSFDLTYISQAGEKKTDSIKKNLNIQPNIDITIFVESSPSPMIEEGKYVLSLKVSNIGDSEIKSVWFELDNTEDIHLLNVQNKQFIGSLDSDDFSSVQYNIYVSKINETEKIEEVPIKVFFKDSFNNNQVLEENVSIKIYSKQASQKFQEQESNGLIIPIVILVLLGVGYWYWKKRKKNASR